MEKYVPNTDQVNAELFTTMPETRDDHQQRIQSFFSLLRPGWRAQMMKFSESLLILKNFYVKKCQFYQLWTLILTGQFLH